METKANLRILQIKAYLSVSIFLKMAFAFSEGISTFAVLLGLPGLSVINLVWFKGVKGSATILYLN